MGIRQKGREGEPCEGSALGMHVMEQPFNPTEARSIEKQADVEHNVQSVSDCLHDADSSATVSPGAYLSECVEVLLHLSLCEGCSFVD